MCIIFHEDTKQFHLSNDWISYIINVLPNGEIGQLYFGKKVHDKDDFSYLRESGMRPTVSCHTNGIDDFSLELTRQEYPAFGTTDLRNEAFEIHYSDGSSVSHFVYTGHDIYSGKKAIAGLPSTYAENESDAQSLELYLKDELKGVKITLFYTIWKDLPIITRRVSVSNCSKNEISLEKVMSISLDMPDADYEWMQFSGSWGRERFPIVRKLECGVTSIESRRGHSSAVQNPFVIVKRPDTNENQGAAMGLALCYSGNFRALAEVDTYGTLRFLMGINPEGFSWPLGSGETFDSPEAILSWTDGGLNSLSQSFHDLYREHLIRGKGKTEPRPILLNNWEATMMDFDEESILKIAAKGKEAGIELFVLDDGWFGARNDDYRGLGDWYANTEKLPEGMGGLSRKINEMGLDFGFWIEPEMVNEDSDLYRAHPDWVLGVPGRDKSLGRHQMVLDFSRKEVVDNIFEQLDKVFGSANVSYIKWDMNRSISECFSMGTDAKHQGAVYHRYILGVYSLYERLVNKYPNILFESCASGGGRFDAGLLYYAPQAWCSDDTDAMERVKIQYGTSYGYPISSIGAHVSAVPNQQTGRNCDIETRANVAYFGTFGYELDLNHLSDEEFEAVKEQIKFMKENRSLIHYGDFYRLQSPFENNISGWMVVSKDRKEAIMACYQMLADVCGGFKRIKLAGLDPDKEYECNGKTYYGDELMNIGMVVTKELTLGVCGGVDHTSAIFKLVTK